MTTMTIVVNGFIARWRGGSFIPVWKAERADEHVPDLMIGLPQSLNRSQADRDDIERIVQEEVG